MAEIGLFRGDNAFALLNNLPIGVFIGVDPYKRYSEFDDNLSNKTGQMAKADLNDVKKNMIERMTPFSNFRFIEDFSTNVAEQFEDHTFDFVFIDGNHYYDYVIDDILQWLPKVKRGGLLAGHDYMEKENCGVIPAVTGLLPDHKYNLKAKVWWYELAGAPEEEKEFLSEIQSIEDEVGLDALIEEEIPLTKKGLPDKRYKKD